MLNDEYHRLQFAHLLVWGLGWQIFNIHYTVPRYTWNLFQTYRARSCTLLLVSLLSSSMFTCFYLFIIQFNVFDHCPPHMALVWVMLMPHAKCYGWAFNLRRCSCHTGSNYIIKKNTELQIQQRILWIKICWNRLKQKLTIWVGMHLHNDKILPAPHPREFEAPTQSKSGHPTGSSQLYGSDCGKVNES